MQHDCTMTGNRFIIHNTITLTSDGNRTGRLIRTIWCDEDAKKHWTEN